MIPYTPLNITEWIILLNGSGSHTVRPYSGPPGNHPRPGVLGPGVGVRIPWPFPVLAQCWSHVEGAILISVTVTLSPTVRAVLHEGLGASTCV